MSDGHGAVRLLAKNNNSIHLALVSTSINGTTIDDWLHEINVPGNNASQIPIVCKFCYLSLIYSSNSVSMP
jgi:hypothetical protein